MSLTTKQRKALPDSAFVDRRRRKYPVPTKKQAAKAGISEKQRANTLRNALSRSAQKNTSGSIKTVRKVVAKRSKGAVASVKRSSSGGRRRR